MRRTVQTDASRFTSERLSPGEAAVGRVPPRDRILAEPPAQEDLLAVTFGGEVDQSRFRVAHDDPVADDLGHGAAGGLRRLEELLAGCAAAVAGRRGKDGVLAFRHRALR